MARQDDVVKERRNFLYIATGAVGTLAVGAAVWPLIDQMNPSKDFLGEPTYEIDMNAIPEGQSVAILMFGQLVVVRHRTAEEIDRAQADDNAPDLIDPETDADRVHRPEWLVISPLCTHMDCVTLDQKGDYGGWFCPCHSAHFDISGRVRKGPAPFNLPAFDHEFLDDNTIKISAIRSEWNNSGPISLKRMNNR